VKAAGYWIDDVAWGRLELLFRRAGIEFHRVQVDFLRRSYRYRFLVGGRRLGKSVVIAASVLIHILECLSSGREPRVRLIAPRHDQLKETVRYLEQMCRGLGLRFENRHSDPLDPRFMVEGHRIDLRIAGKQTAHRGGWASLVCIDEARDMDGTVFFEAVRPMLLDVAGQLVVVSSPRGRNWFIQYAESLGLEYYRGVFDINSSDYFVSEVLSPDSACLIQAPSWVNPFISRQDIEQMLDEMSVVRVDSESGKQERTVSPIFLSEVAAAILDDYGHPFPIQPIFAEVGRDKKQLSRLAIGLDYGTEAAFAAIWVYKHIDGNFYAADEVYETALSPQDQVDRLIARGVPQHAMLVADKSLWNRDGRKPVHQIWREYAQRKYHQNWNGRLVPATGDANFERGSSLTSQKRGVRQHMLELLRSVLNEGRLIIDPLRCPNLVSEIVNAKMRPNTYLDIEKPDHAIMALAYAVDYLYNLPMPNYRSVQHQFTLEELIEYQDKKRSQESSVPFDDAVSILSLGTSSDDDELVHRRREASDYWTRYEWVDENDATL